MHLLLDVASFAAIGVVFAWLSGSAFLGFLLAILMFTLIDMRR